MCVGGWAFPGSACVCTSLHVPGAPVRTCVWPCVLAAGYVRLVRLAIGQGRALPKREKKRAGVERDRVLVKALIYR